MEEDFITLDDETARATLAGAKTKALEQGKPKIGEMIEAMNDQIIQINASAFAWTVHGEIVVSQWARKTIVFEAILKTLELMRDHEKDIVRLVRGKRK